MPQHPSLASRVVRLAQEAWWLVRDHLELAALDARLAAMGLAKMITAAVVASVLVVTAWLLFVASAIVWVTDNGINWIAALAIAGAVNVALAVALALWIKSHARDLGFEATLRQLRRTAEDAGVEAP
ncbi:MAG: phage holin family protein [Burkholderiales bacterium]